VRVRTIARESIGSDRSACRVPATVGVYDLEARRHPMTLATGAAIPYRPTVTEGDVGARVSRIAPRRQRGTVTTVPTSKIPVRPSGARPPHRRAGPPSARRPWRTLRRGVPVAAPRGAPLSRARKDQQAADGTPSPVGGQHTGSTNHARAHESRASSPLSSPDVQRCVYATESGSRVWPPRLPPRSAQVHAARLRRGRLERLRVSSG